MRNNSILMPAGHRYSWDDAVSISQEIWGPFAWRQELRLRCNVVERTLVRWHKAGEVPGSVSAMLNAFLRLRRNRMVLPAQKGCMP